VNSPPPKPEVILTNFFAEPTVLLVPITSRDYDQAILFYIYQVLLVSHTTENFTGQDILHRLQCALNKVHSL
jgi:hypothetical protein